MSPPWYRKRQAPDYPSRSFIEKLRPRKKQAFAQSHTQTYVHALRYHSDSKLLLIWSICLKLCPQKKSTDTQHTLFKKLLMYNIALKYKILRDYFINPYITLFYYQKYDSKNGVILCFLPNTRTSTHTVCIPHIEHKGGSVVKSSDSEARYLGSRP